MLVFDHNEPRWNKRYMRRGRENGAATYSREIVKFQVPLWKKQLRAHKIKSKDVVISTCPLLSQVEDIPEGKHVIQYLHTYRYDNPVGDARDVLDNLVNPKSVVFVTAYKGLCHQLNRRGIRAIFVPMTIDSEAVLAAAVEKMGYGKRVVYFGNVTGAKESTYQQVVKELRRRAWTVDTISSGKLNGVIPLTQEEAWARISQYDYGIGVGRCALEMMALGLKVIVSGQEFGGLVVSTGDFVAQTSTNFNGRVITFNRDIAACVDCFDDSLVGLSNDIQSLTPTIEEIIKKYLDGANL